jgi:hypothetical protein
MPHSVVLQRDQAYASAVLRRRISSTADDARLIAQVDAEIAEEFRKAEEASDREEQRLTCTIIVRTPATLMTWLENKRRQKQAKLPGHRVSTSDVVRGLITAAMQSEAKSSRRG